MKSILKEIDFLAPFITDKRKAKIEEVLEYRTKYLSVVLEDIYQPQNASAVIRTCDAFGIQDVHIIENKHEYRINPLVTQGCEKWIGLHRYNMKDQNSLECIKHLKSKGYLIVATSLENYDYELYDLPIDQKMSIVFGTEKNGITTIMKESADIKVKIPMYGFSQSFNISVSAAITISSLIPKIQKLNADWRLTENEKVKLRFDWYKKITDFENKVTRGNFSGNLDLK